MTPETFGLVSDGLCGNCRGGLYRQLPVPFGWCINCDLYWRCGTDPESDVVWVERRKTTRTTPSGTVMDSIVVRYPRLMVETYKG
jgi:hypothetical protein